MTIRKQDKAMNPHSSSVNEPHHLQTCFNQLTHIALPAPLGLAVSLAEAAGEDGLLVLPFLDRLVLQRLDPLLHFL